MMYCLIQCIVVAALTMPTARAVNPTLESKTSTKKKASLPTSFAECVDVTIQPNAPQHLIQSIQNRCLDRFISVDHTHNWASNFTMDEQNYIKSLFRKVISDASQMKNVHNRRKRAIHVFPRRVRREVRDPPYKNWLNYANNVKRLKYDTISPTGRSKYDIIADIHSTAVNSAHFGPNFLPWHRLYLIILETALDVPIPYWDSTIDYEMDDPTQSILWSKRYYGNGIGYVKTGPFANFQTPVGPLYRNIGSDGSLFNKRDINVIFNKLRLSQISEPNADERASLEGQHNGVHIWVDGQMNNLDLSPHDPVFFAHHSFVDYIWEVFRTLQSQRGIDPTTDTFTPPANVTFQNITEPTVGLAGYYNNDGYSKRIAAMVQYGQPLLCPLCSKSKDVYCDKMKHVCVSERRSPFEYRGKLEDAKKAAKDGGMEKDGPNYKPFSLYYRDRRARMDSVTMDYDQTMQNGGNGNTGNSFAMFMMNGGRPLNMRQTMINEPNLIMDGRRMNTRNLNGNHIILDRGNGVYVANHGVRSEYTIDLNVIPRNVYQSNNYGNQNTFHVQSEPIFRGRYPTIPQTGSHSNGNINGIGYQNNYNQLRMFPVNNIRKSTYALRT